jgi:uncharacterized protein
MPVKYCPAKLSEGAHKPCPMHLEVTNKSSSFDELAINFGLTIGWNCLYSFNTERAAPPPMKISVDEIPQTPKEINFSESVEDLNGIYNQTKSRDFRFPEAFNVSLAYYRSGQEIFIHGRFQGELKGCCGRCLEEYRFALAEDFDLVLTPDPGRSDRRIEELSRSDLGLSFYSTDEIDLAPLIAEQIMLALPTRPLCSENCQGLCASCGANLNRETCSCTAAMGDPRMAIFRTLKVGR